MEKTLTKTRLCLRIQVGAHPFFDDRPSSINDDLNEMPALDYRTFMVDDVLNRATMSTSIEGRVLLLDHRILEFVARLPTSF